MAQCRRPTIKIETGKKLQPALKWRDPRKSTNSVTPRVKSNADRENRNMSSKPFLRSVTAPTPSCAHTSTHVFPADVSDKQLTFDKKKTFVSMSTKRDNTTDHTTTRRDNAFTNAHHRSLKGKKGKGTRKQFSVTPGMQRMT